MHDRRLVNILWYFVAGGTFRTRNCTFAWRGNFPADFSEFTTIFSGWRLRATFVHSERKLVERGKQDSSQ